MLIKSANKATTHQRTNNKAPPPLSLSHPPTPQIAGTIPPEILELSDLSVLKLHNNTLTGTIPSGLLGNLTNLTQVTLAPNALRGCVPKDLASRCADRTLVCEGAEGATPVSEQACGELAVCGVEAAAKNESSYACAAT